MKRNVDYIFSISTGRSGSHYLQGLLAASPDCLSLHEPDPIGNQEAMRAYAQGDDVLMRQVVAEKLSMIGQVNGSGSVYAETNHCFIKGFGWLLPETLPPGRIGVVLLHRDAEAIVESHLRIQCTPLVKYGRRWISTPDMRDPMVRPPHWRGLSPRLTYRIARIPRLALRAGEKLLDLIGLQTVALRPPRRLDEYERKCLRWYVAETEARGEAFKLEFPEVKYVDATIDDLNSIEFVRKMFELFGISEGKSLEAVVGQATNRKDNLGDRVDNQDGVSS